MSIEMESHPMLFWESSNITNRIVFI
jgi:hypothetical protein